MAICWLSMPMLCHTHLFGEIIRGRVHDSECFDDLEMTLRNKFGMLRNSIVTISHATSLPLVNHQQAPMILVSLSLLVAM